METQTRKKGQAVITEASLLNEEKGLRKLYHAAMDFDNNERPVN